MRLPDPREGEEVRVRQRAVPYSRWPTVRGGTREKMQTAIFATDPWFLIEGAASDLSDDAARKQASAFARQARDFYRASNSSGVDAAKPLLFYYCILNLAKCFVVVRTGSAITGRISHGLSEHLPTTPGAIHGEVSFNPSALNGAFQLFAQQLGQVLPAAVAPQTNVRIRSQDFLSQILVGHRMFCSAENFLERFINVSKLEYIHDSNLRTIWLKARFEKQDIRRFGYTGGDISASLGRVREWRNVTSLDNLPSGVESIDYEFRTVNAFSQRPSETLNDVSAVANGAFWQVVSSTPPYRRYYTYVNTPSQTVLHQLLTMYMAAFYFGSIVRYKPEGFSDILNSKIGPFVHEFLDNQQNQFIYLIASEILCQEISKPAVV